MPMYNLLEYSRNYRKTTGSLWNYYRDESNSGEIAENNNKLLKQLKTGYRRTTKWNRYRSEMSNQTKTNNLNYLIAPTFTNVNRLFLLSFENENDRTSFSKCYIPKFEIKDFNVLTDGKPFFETPAKNKEEAYEAIIKMSKNNDMTIQR